MRIEDVDEPRTRPGAADAILGALEHLGFEWDGDVWRQSSRRDVYEAALAQLFAHGIAYRCACTRRELATAPLGRIGERVYPGTCRGGVAGARALRRRTAVRVQVSSTSIEFVDRLQGQQRQRLADDVGDFIVRRSDGLFAYQLAVVVDDAAQEITDVVRGADLLASTPRQIFLQRALGLPTPRYLHVPVAVDASDAKLSKATGAQRCRRRHSPRCAPHGAFSVRLRRAIRLRRCANSGRGRLQTGNRRGCRPSRCAAYNEFDQ